MKYLLDTHILIWAANSSLPKAARNYFSEENELFFSPVSIWEIVIKRSLNRDDFQIDPDAFYSGLRQAGYKELAVSSRHALGIQALSQLHKDPFDRMLLSQAISERMDLITADERLVTYPARVILV